MPRRVIAALVEAVPVISIYVKQVHLPKREEKISCKLVGLFHRDIILVEKFQAEAVRQAFILEPSLTVKANF